MSSNINQSFSLSGFESDTSIDRDATKLTINHGVEFEMQSLGLGGEVVAVTVGPSVRVLKVDKTDWANAIK